MHAWWLCGLILAFEHFSDQCSSSRLSTSLILQFAGWNSRPCLGLPPPNNGKPLTTSYWPTTWLIKTGVESRCQLTVKPIKPNSAPHRKQSLSPWLWIRCLAQGAKTQFFLIMRRGLHMRNGKCHLQYFNLALRSGTSEIIHMPLWVSWFVLCDFLDLELRVFACLLWMVDCCIIFLFF